jgi:3-oxoacyl-[acyl-carrier-protein] synthase-3
MTQSVGTTMIGCTITGMGTALPEQVVGNDELVALFETSDQWIRERSGIVTRRVAAGPLAAVPAPAHVNGGLGTTGTLAAEAGRRALEAAGLTADRIDLLVLCTTSPDQQVPANSAAVAAALGITRGAMDLNAACAGFTYGLVTSAGLLATGARHILLVGAETLTRITNWSDRTSAFLFGDGAGAAVVSSVAGEGSLLGWDLGVDGSLVDLLYADHGDGMVMKGQEVFRRAVRVTVDSAVASLERAKVTADQLALFVPHQANLRIMESVAAKLGIRPERVASVIAETGNTSSASIPLALARAVEAGRLADGDLVLLAGFGAGMTWASAVWRWQAPG